MRCGIAHANQLPLPRLQSAPGHVFIAEQRHIKYWTFTFCVQNISESFQQFFTPFLQGRKFPGAAEKSISFCRGCVFFVGSWIIFQNSLPLAI